MANPEDLGRYRLKRLLGRGVLGQVWEATEVGNEGTKVAVKIVHAADEELTHVRLQFAREARRAAGVRHPNVVSVQDSGAAAGTSFMVMEMVEGTPLRKLVGDPSVPTSDKLAWLRQIGDGLAAMHAVSLAHRDLKPENVIVRADRTVCIVDLGMAKWSKIDLGGERDPMDLDDEPEARPPNTDYAPPEAINEHFYDALGDQYAWGVLAYELLTGVLPKDGAPPLAAGGEITAAAVEAIERARARRRDDRWEGMASLLERFPGGPEPATGEGAKAESASPAAIDEPANSARPSGAAQMTPASRRATWAIVLGVGLLLLVVGLVVAGLR